MDDEWYPGVLSDLSSEIEQTRGASMRTIDLIPEQFGPFNSLEFSSLFKSGKTASLQDEGGWGCLP